MNDYQSTLYQALQLKYHLKTIYPRIEETGLELLVSALTEYNPGIHIRITTCRFSIKLLLARKDEPKSTT